MIVNSQPSLNADYSNRYKELILYAGNDAPEPRPIVNTLERAKKK